MRQPGEGWHWRQRLVNVANAWGEPVTIEMLSPRQTEIALLVAKGYDNQAIADELKIDERTARTHVSDILSKWHCTNRTQIAIIARQIGLIGKLDGNGLPTPNTALEALEWSRHYADLAMQMIRESANTRHFRRRIGITKNVKGE